MKKDRLLSARVLLIIVYLRNFSSADGVDRSSIGTELSAIISLKARFVDSNDLLHDWKVQGSLDANRSAHCNWAGILCSSDGAVTKIDLSGMNLTGTVSDDIQNLRNLKSLVLCRNGFSGSLPESITSLTNLRVVDVSENAFVGTLPAVLGLATLNASGNNLSGVIPEDLGNASSLESLDLRGNFFEGSIPESFKNLQRLRFLGLSGNNFSGDIPPVLGQLSGLQSLILGYNSFGGGIPAEFGNLTDLRYLDVAESNLGGRIPAELGKMKQLDTIFLYRNNFHGRIPEEIGNSSSLSFIDFSDNLIAGEIPASVAELKNLKLLNLMSNEISGSVPPSISKLTQLRVLALWNNSISGRLPIDLGLNSPLQSLDVSSNSFSGEIPTTLCNSGNLTKLILFRNNFSGPMPATLTRCGSLVRVRIQNNRISGPIPTGFGELKLLQRLELAKNSLTGKIPFDLGFSTSLSFIDISSNELRSSLPSNLFSVRTLQTFLASNCNLHGEIEIGIPDGFNAPLSVLDLSENVLSGGIPASITAYRKLVNLNMSSNRLTGEIPKGIATMTMLSIMDVSRNSLTGKIPENLGTSPALETVNVSHNNLEGPVPQNGVLRNINPSNLAGNEGLFRTTTLGNETKPRRHQSATTRWIIGISVIAAAVAAASLAKSMWNRSFESDKKKELPWRLIAFQKLDFTSSDVLSCVNESNVIGIGATGIVYRAEVRSGVVAVKKLWRSEVQTRMKNSDDDLAGEVNLLGRLRHRNIVRLLGFAHNGVDTMIVYEYMKNGNLREALHGEETGRLLVDWVSRYNVTIDVAQGLAYLHHDCHPRVIHRDIKSSNILLDGNLEARIADFGLARMIGKKNEPVSTVAGSYGYIAPEYGYTLKVDEKSDVYSYGVVLLELVTGKPAVAAEFGDGGDVVEWIRRRSRGGRCLDSVLDESIGGECRHVREEMMLVLRIALICTARLPRDRPSMRDVITMLEEAKPRRKSNTALLPLQ